MRLARSADRHDELRGFYPSLHLNMASSYESLGDTLAAHAHLVAAEDGLDALPDTPYTDVVRTGLDNVRDRLDNTVR